MQNKLIICIAFLKLVFCKFKEEKSYLLKNLTFNIKKNELVAIVGHVGTGKVIQINNKLFHFFNSLLYNFCYFFCAKI